MHTYTHNSYYHVPATSSFLTESMRAQHSATSFYSRIATVRVGPRKAEIGKYGIHLIKYN